MSELEELSPASYAVTAWRLKPR